MEERRLYKIDNIRAFAIILVVLGHSIILYSSNWDIYSTNVSVPFLDMIKNIIDIIQMPLFFSLSGYLFCYTYNKNIKIKNLIFNKFIRLLIPYLIIYFCYLLPIRYCINYPEYNNLNVLLLFHNFLFSSDVGQLWFLPALFCIFVLCKIILSVINKFSDYLDIFLMIIAGCLYLEGYHIALNYPPFLNAFNYIIWFSLGYLLCFRKKLLDKLYYNNVFKITLLLINIFMIIIYLCSENITVFFYLCLRSLCIVNVFEFISNVNNTLLFKISKNSFGIYLFHSPLIYITFSLIPNASPILIVFVNFIVFGLIAYCLTDVIRKTKLKFVIGE